MRLPLLPPGQSYGEWLDRLDLRGLAGDAAGLVEYQPYLKAFLGAVAFFRRTRAKLFFRSLKSSIDPLPEAKKKAFEQMLRSKDGAEVLAEYAEAVVRTASRTAIAALAILYSDTANETYAPSFKLAAAIALEGISETEVDIFIDLSGVKDTIDSKNQPNPPYPVAVVNDKLVSSLPHVSELLAAPEVRVNIARDLINRGLLLPDFASGRYSDGGVGITYGLGEATGRFKDLLLRARALLPDVDNGSA